MREMFGGQKSMRQMFSGHGTIVQRPAVHGTNVRRPTVQQQGFLMEAFSSIKRILTFFLTEL